MTAPDTAYTGALDPQRSPPSTPERATLSTVEERVRVQARERLQQAEDILRSIDAEWTPPPYDPLLIAQALGIRCIPVNVPWVQDAMIVVMGGEPVIYYRPGKDEARLRFSLFHEIAHTLFPDFRFNPRYDAAHRPRLLEPAGRLEHLCDVAAYELMMPMDRFRRDLAGTCFGADAVRTLCLRYGAGEEHVAVRMVETDMACYCVSRLENARTTRQDGRRQMRVVYSMATTVCRSRGFTLPASLQLPRRSCVLLASRSRKQTAGEEVLDLGQGRLQRFRIDALPLRRGVRRRGLSPVLAFLYPLST